MATRALTISCLIIITHMLASLAPVALAEELPVPRPEPLVTESIQDPHSVRIDIRLVELQVGKMRELGFEFASLGEEGRVRQAREPRFLLERGEQYDPRQVGQLLDALQQNDLAFVTAEPQVVTLDGRPARIEVNSEVTTERRFGKTKKKNEMIGLQLEVLPKLIDGNRCRVELKLDWSGIVHDRSAVARLRQHRIDTAFTAQNGKTLVVSTVRANEGHTESEETLLLLVTPTVVDPVKSDHQTAKKTSGRR